VSDQEQIRLMIVLLQGIRGMAEVEAVDGSKAWAKCVEAIDAILGEVKGGK